MIHLLIPERFEGRPGAGQWKDLQGIRLILGQLEAEWREFSFDGDTIDSLADQIGASSDTVIWYYTFWPEAMQSLKARCPQVRILLRTVNAEALQHWARAKKDWRQLRGLPRDVYGFLRLLRRDRRCAHLSDALAGISAWDDAHYWRKLAAGDILHPAPYLCPWPLLKPEVKVLPWEARENTIVCLAGSRDAIGRGHVDGFAKLARRPEFSEWHFAASAGLLDAAEDPWPDDVERMGRLADPWELLCKVKAVAVLSPFGTGCKTTVTDALAAGCHVLVHPRQHARLPVEEQARAIPLDPQTPAALDALTETLSLPPKEAETRCWNERLACATAAWKDALRI
jgi:hypothetical protein